MSVTSGNSFNSRTKFAGGGFVGGGPKPQLNPAQYAYHGYAGRPRRAADSQWSMNSDTPWYAGPVGELETEEEYEEEMDVDTKTLLTIQSLVGELRRRSYKLSDYVMLLNEEKADDDDEDVDEASGAGAVAGFTGPLTKQTPKEKEDLLKVSPPYGPYSKQ